MTITASSTRGEPMEPEKRTVQVRVRPKNIVAGHSEGAVLFITPSMARVLKEHNAIDIIGDVAAPGPKETKPLEPSEKKFSDAQASGPTTASASSSLSGLVPPASSSVEGQASPPISSESQTKPASGDQYEGLRSTTRIKLRAGRTSSTSRTAAGGNGTAKGKTSRRSKG